MRKRALWGGVAAGIIVAGAAAFAALAYRPAIAPLDAPPQTAADAAKVERGRRMAAAGNCASCHTVDGGAGDFAGGLPVNSDFGTIYSTNITPDMETGIGSWSEAAFFRSMRHGVRRDGAHLFPAFPYDHFTKIDDADIGALYAYLMTLAPVRATAPENTLPAPLGWRALQGGWKLLFFRNAGAYRADTGESEAWNRGKYLAEGVGHCSACHSPRNALGAEKTGRAAYSGAEVGAWYAPAINGSPDAAVPWAEEDMFAFLRTGASPLHGVAAGSMSEVIHVGLRELPDADIRALSVYFADIGADAFAGRSAEIPSLLSAPDADLDAAQTRGGQLFRSFCVSCHFTAPDAPMASRPALSVNSAVVGPDPTLFVHVTLNGIPEDQGGPGTSMPGFGALLNDRDVADLAAYMRAAYADGRQWSGVEEKSAEIRARPQ